MQSMNDERTIVIIDSPNRRPMTLSLCSQINVVNERKEYLERKIALLVGEREGLSCDLDETSEKMIVLERHNREQETKVSERGS